MSTSTKHKGDVNILALRNGNGISTEKPEEKILPGIS
jgi:hypothetical protein